MRLKPKVTQVTFKADGFKLKGTIYHPLKKPINRAIIGSHGLLSDRTSLKQKALAIQCIDMDIAYFVFDHRGCGQSEGEFEQVTTLDNRVRDLMAAVTAIQAKTGCKNRLGLFGSSMGGAVCLAASAQIKPLAIVTVAAPLKSAALVRNDKNAIDTGNFSPSFYEEKLQFDITAKTAGVKNLLLFHGDSDETVPVSHARTIYTLAAEPKKMVIQKGGDHRMSRPGHQKSFITLAAHWYLTHMSK